MLNSEITSRISSTLKSNSKDGRLSRRLILSVAESKAKFLISQKLNDKSLFREDNLFKNLNCFALKADNIISCDVIAFRRCKSLMKSKKKLPKLLYSKFGNSILSITTIDGSVDFLPITLTSYNLLKDRPSAKFVKQNYYYINDGYLYLPDSEIKAVNILLLTLESEKIDELSECSDTECKSVWDYDFVCSDKILEVVIQETLNEILGSNKKIPEDTNPNMDENQRGKTTV